MQRENWRLYWGEIIPLIYYTLAEVSGADASALCLKLFESVPFSTGDSVKHKK